MIRRTYRTLHEMTNDPVRSYFEQIDSSDDANYCLMMIKQGVDVDTRDREFGLTGLHMCVKKGNWNTFTMLLDEGADPNIPDFDGYSPLYWAMMGNRREFLIPLLEAGADPNIFVSKDGMTPIHTAARIGDMDLMNVFIKYNASMGATDDNGMNTLLYAIKGNTHEIVQFLINEYDFDLNKKINGKSYMDYATEWKVNNSIKALKVSKNNW